MKRLILSVFVMLALAACNEDDDVGNGDGEATTEEGATATE
ncbi:MAG: hypothetical protein V2I65_07275 [Paracoccaceae bacterium]|jgi:hypothetical protein|nr:hypothetical protein [Paracoccaceae bacterium]